MREIARSFPGRALGTPIRRTGDRRPATGDRRRRIMIELGAGGIGLAGGAEAAGGAERVLRWAEGRWAAVAAVVDAGRGGADDGRVAVEGGAQVRGPADLVQHHAVAAGAQAQRDGVGGV